MRAALLMLFVLAPAATAGPRLTVKLPADARAARGRLVVAVGPRGSSPGFDSPEATGTVVVGQDVELKPGGAVELDAAATGSVAWPAADSWAALPAGTYAVRAALLTNPDDRRPNATGNRLASATVALGPDESATVTLDRVAPALTLPQAPGRLTVEVPSAKLTAFRKRPVTLKVGVVLPPNFAADTTGHYLLAVWTGGFGSRFTAARRLAPDPRFVQIALDGAGPFGDPYQVDSASGGPYGEALVAEVIPLIEARFRCGGPNNRFLTGASTGGWVSLALQITYPDVFNGAWGQCPDPLDFRAFQLADLSRDENMYVNRHGAERPARRERNGDTVYSVRREVRLERVLGDGGKWELGGGQWASWNAAYGPRGPDGNPVPLWDGETGVIDRALLGHWAKSDLRKRLESEWPKAGPGLAGKLHVWVGTADDYFLDGGVKRFGAAAEALKNPAFGGEVVVEPGRGHESGWGAKAVLDAMAARAKR